jgi:LytS/YehU family sensor histidine kinase
MKKIAPVIDLLCVLIFVAIGRNAHEHGITFSGMLSTFWPFGTGLLIGWIVLMATRRDVIPISSGVLIALSTVIIGMLLRVIAGQGTALSFIIVATIFLMLFLVGWRFLYRRLVK